MVMLNFQGRPGGDDEIEAARARSDDRRALTLLMARYGDGVFRFAMAMTRDHNLADEIRQQVFVEAYRDLGNLAARSSLQGWVFGIARNRCLDAIHARNRWNTRYKNDPRERDPEQDDCTPDHDLDRSRLARILVACLAQLAPAAREAVVLRFQQELSYDEAAAITGEAPGTLRKRVARALPVLRKCVAHHLHPGEPQ
jgi:RNA polymerase sigma-70 factor (ECF subfamily)